MAAFKAVPARGGIVPRRMKMMLCSGGAGESRKTGAIIVVGSARDNSARLGLAASATR